MCPDKSKKLSVDEEKQKKGVLQRYRQRLTIVKQAQEASSKGNYLAAIQNYNAYLSIVADFKDIPVESLAPQHFDMKKDLSELLLISHVYWDLAKIYDLTPKLEKEFRKSLAKFVKFTIGLKYQPINSTLIRRYLRKRGIRHLAEFKEANKQIFTHSKKCYVATFCFGEDHQVTNDLRRFRNEFLLKRRFGVTLVHYYYLYAPQLVIFLESVPVFGSAIKKISRICLYIFAKCVLVFI